MHEGRGPPSRRKDLKDLIKEYRAKEMGDKDEQVGHIEIKHPGCLLAFEMRCRTFAMRRFAENVSTFPTFLLPLHLLALFVCRLVQWQLYELQLQETD